MDIEKASKELYSKLRVYDEVVGVSVYQKDNVKYIVIYLKEMSKIILDQIPSTYKENDIKIELMGNISFQ